MVQKKNVVLYLDSELVRTTRELGFNLSKTCENHLKHLINRLGSVNTTKTGENCMVGSPEEIRTPVSGSRARHAWPLHSAEGVCSFLHRAASGLSRMKACLL
jgi:hypothetical protein